MLEYALLLGVVIAGILIMQFGIKRSLQGNLKGSADKIGDQFSASSTGILHERQMDSDQDIIEEVATRTSDDYGVHNYVNDPAVIEGTLDKGVYSFTKRTGGDTNTIIKKQTDAAKFEETRWDSYPQNDFDAFTDPFDPGPFE